jgi:undecaprenyl-diphosphatase
LPWALLAGLAGAILAVLLFAWLAGEVLQQETLSFDNQVRTGIHQYASTQLTAVMELVTWLGSAWVLVPVGALVVAGFWRSGHRREALAFVVIMLGAVLLQFLLKLAFHRVRPLPFFGPALHTYGFPSGHALNSLCFYGALAALLASPLRRWWQRVGLAVAAAILVLLIGVSRVYLGVHYPTDVVGGYLAGVVWLSTVGLAFREIPHWFPSKRDISALAAGRAPR